MCCPARRLLGAVLDGHSCRAALAIFAALG